jgi:serine/threonine-protein kinase
MSAVYRARHVRTNRTVAVKVLSAGLTGDQEYRTRFLEEAQRASRVDEPHIIDVYDADEEQGRLYLAMRFVEGGDLSGLLKRGGPLPSSRALRFIEQVAQALDAAHAQGLVHRDVKPANILMGPNEHVYLSDFGIAKASAGRTLTQTGMFVGSPDYAAPEQWEGLRDIDGRADQYALAGVLHVCLTGARPYERDSITGLMYAHLQLPPPQITESRPDLPPALDTVIARAMAKDRAERYGSCREFTAAARAAVEAGGALPTQLAADATRLAPGGETVASTPVPAAPPPPPAATPQTAPIPGGPAPAAPAAPGHGRTWIVAGVAGAVLLVAGTIVGVVLATRGGGNANTATTSATGSAAFSEPPSLFGPIDRGDASATFIDDGYVFELKKASRPLLSEANRAAPLDVRAQVDVQSADADYGAAVLCRFQSQRDYYLVAILSGQRYNIVKYVDGKQRSLQGGIQTSSVIRPGAATNHVEAQCYGTGTVVVNLIVNGSRVSSVADAEAPLTGGRVGLRANTTEPTVHVRFEKFVMSKLKNP